MPVRVPRLLNAALASAALFLLLAAPASAQFGSTYIAATPQASTTDPSNWTPNGIPQNGDTIITTETTQLLSIDADLALGSLRTDNSVNTPIIRLTGGTRATIGTTEGIPLELRNPTILGTGGQNNELTFTMGAAVHGALRIGNGLTINVDNFTGFGGLTFTGGGIQFIGPVSGEPTPAIHVRNGQSIVAGPLSVSGLANAIRPVFSVDEPATLRFTENANVGAALVTRFAGHVLAESGATLGRLEGTGVLDVRQGSSNPVVTLGSASLQEGEVNFVQGADGLFPTLSSAASIDVERSRIRTIANAHADQEAAPQRQSLIASSTSFGGLDNRHDAGRIDRGSAWVPSMLQSNELVTDRRVLARKEPSGNDLPERAELSGNALIGSDLVCNPGEYNHEIETAHTLGTFYRDGLEVATHVPSYRLTAADHGHQVTCAALVVDKYGNQIDDPALGSINAAFPAEPATPADPATPTVPSTPAPQTPAAPSAPAAPTATATTPAAPSAPRAARAVATPVPAIAAAATTPARCPTIAELNDVSSAWKLAASTKSQTTLTGTATPGIWRCSVTGTENGTPVVVRSLPVLVANQQRAMLTSESATTPKLRNPTLMSSGTQRISARLYARGGDAKLKTRTTRFTQTVRKGANTLRFTQTVGGSLPQGRYKLVVRAITKDGVSAPLVQEVTIT